MKAREWIEHCSRSEWNNDTMRKIAQERFDEDPTLDCITVYEHAGWQLTFNRDLVTVGSANDRSQFSREAHEWAAQFDGWNLVGWCRRHDDKPHDIYRAPSYFPAIAKEYAASA